MVLVLFFRLSLICSILKVSTIWIQCNQTLPTCLAHNGIYLFSKLKTIMIEQLKRNFKFSAVSLAYLHLNYKRYYK